MISNDLDRLYDEARDERPFSNGRQPCKCGCGETAMPNRRFVIGHNARLRGIGTFEERFWAKVQKSDGCWTWAGSIRPNGYGQVRGADGRTVKAHRASYELCMGPIPEGLELDHRCHSEDADCAGGNSCLHRRCVNPEHLEPVTHAENGRRSVLARRTHCPQGHPYSEENTYRSKSGRNCRTCAAQTGPARYRAWRQRQKGATNANS